MLAILSTPPHGMAMPSACIAGGGIGGLFTAVTLRKQGYDVAVYERTKEYRPFGGPIQIASNGLEAVKRIDASLHDEIIAEANCIGDRINGLKDGISNEWFATFDLASPAAKRGQQPSVVIDRPVLQELLLRRVGDCVTKGVEVVGCEKNDEDGTVTALLGDGSHHTADFLIGSDGLGSKMRAVLNPDEGAPAWSGYTCFAAIANCVPHDIKEVGYKVFLGRRKYFVSVDVGGGRIQWYAFLNIPPGGVPAEARRGQGAIDFLRPQLEGWSEEVFQLLDSTPARSNWASMAACTPFEQVEQRDLYDRPPQLAWATGRVCLLGDAAHPMMPNLGQGGCMAIEDAFVLGRELERIDHARAAAARRQDGRLRAAIPLALKRYNQNRVVRAAAVQGMSRLSSAILFQYNHPRPPGRQTWHRLTDVPKPSHLPRVACRPLELDASSFPPRLRNTAPKSACARVITRMGQGFLQAAAFPLQFEFLFDFPGSLAETRVEGLSPLERLLMRLELAASGGLGRAAGRAAAYEGPKEA